MKIKNYRNSKNSKEFNKFVWGEFIEFLSHKPQKELDDFLSRIISQTEKELIINRLLVISLLKDGKSYKDIERELWVSPNTIRTIKKNSGEYKSSRHYAKNKNVKKGKESTIVDYWLNFPFPKISGRGRWKFLNYQG